MMEEDLPELLLAGYVPLRDKGFALPCYASGSWSNAWYCAVCSVQGDRTGVIIGFEPFQADDIVRLQPAAARTVSIGDPWHDVLLWNGKQFVGTPDILVDQLGSELVQLAVEAPLTALDLAMASDKLDRGASTATAFAHVKAQWGEEEAEHWRSDGFTRQQLVTEARRLLVDAGVPDIGVVRGIEVRQRADALQVHIPEPLLNVLRDHGLFSVFTERAAAFGRATGLPLAPIPDLVDGAGHFGLGRDKAETPAENVKLTRASGTRSYPAAAADVLVLASGSRSRQLLRFLRPTDWAPRWDHNLPYRGEVKATGQYGTAHPNFDVHDDRDGLPDLRRYGAILWLVDDESYLKDHGRVTGKQLQAALSATTNTLCIMAPVLPAQRPSQILADQTLASDLPLFDVILDTSVVRSPFWTGNPRRSIDRRVADLVSVTARIAAPGSPLNRWLADKRKRIGPLLLSISSSGHKGNADLNFASEVSSSGIEGGRGAGHMEFAWKELPLKGKHVAIDEGRAIVRKHDTAFRPFAEAVLHKYLPGKSQLDLFVSEVPSSILENLYFPHLTMGFRIAGRRRGENCVLTAEAPNLSALRAASEAGWSIIRYLDEKTIRSLGSSKPGTRAMLPSDIALPGLNRLGRNRGLAIRGVDPRDVLRVPVHVFEPWRDRYRRSGLVSASRWYRSSVARPDELSTYEATAAIPAELFARAEEDGDVAALYLRENVDVVVGADISLAKRTSDLRVSWSDPAEGLSRFMLEDGILPVRYSALEKGEVAAQKFFTIDGDASVPLLFTSRLFHVWARATLTRSPSWSSRFSITRTFETFPIPEQFLVGGNGETGRASLQAGPRARSLSRLYEQLNGDEAGGGPARSERDSSDMGNGGGLYAEVDQKLLGMIDLPPDATDLEILERLVGLNRMSGSDVIRPGRRR